MTGTISTESILITVESNWIQMLLHVKRRDNGVTIKGRSVGIRT